MVPYNLGIEPDQWMEERIKLFFDYCYPSVLHQSKRNFRWVVFFDPRTPKRFLDQIKARDSEEMIEWKFTDHWNKMDAEIISFLKASSTKEDLIISTRLDCDDGLAVKFVRKVQDKVSQLDCIPPYALNSSHGIILNANTGIFHRKTLQSNAFISLVQKSEALDQSIFAVQHQEISDQVKTIQVEEPKMWLQVVHGRNLLNKTSGLPLIKDLSADFHILSSISQKKFQVVSLVRAYLYYVKVRLSNAKFKAKRAMGKLSASN